MRPSCVIVTAVANLERCVGIILTKHTSVTSLSSVLGNHGKKMKLVSSGYLSVTRQGKSHRAHRYKVESILGKKLPRHAVVHHRDGNKKNNENYNLVVCENDRYHKFIELRESAYRATGDVNKRKCVFCQGYDSISNMCHQLSYATQNGSGQYLHRRCATIYRRNLRSKQRLTQGYING